MKFISAVLVIFAPVVQAQSIYDLFGTDKFHRAYVQANTNEANTSEITFEPFQELNWEAKARIALPWLNLDRPTPAQVVRLSTFESAGPQFRSADFRAPLEPAVSRGAYLLIHASGIVALQPTQLKGSVNFNFDAGMTAVERKAVFGTIVGKPLRPANTAAFVILGRPADVTDVHPGAKLEKRKQANPAIYDLTDGTRTVSWTTGSNEQSGKGQPGEDQPEVASALSFRMAGEKWLLVKWNTDFCASAYTLFSVASVLTPIAGNDYDCDP